MRKFNNILVTGGCGFIGANFIKYLFDDSGYANNVINIDKLTYAGNPLSIRDVSERYTGERYHFYPADICDVAAMKDIFEKHAIDCVVHFAAESHVDRSIHGAGAFIQTNIVGTFSLLETARSYWSGRDDVLFHHVSTDEVYGSLGEEGQFFETTPYDPRSPYSASKASSDHLVMSYHHTHGLPVTISNCSNNYGPYQFPEKLIPLMIDQLLAKKPLPVYGDGKNVRDWLYVIDHCTAVFSIISKGSLGHTYNVGGENEWQNIELVHALCEAVAEKTGDDPSEYKKQITFVTDRPGHDRRYAINCNKIKTQLGWTPSVSFEEGLKKTVDWYLDNRDWVNQIKSGEYKSWIEANYGQR